MANELELLKLLQQRKQPQEAEPASYETPPEQLAENVAEEEPQEEPSAIEAYENFVTRKPSNQERWGRVIAAAADTWGGGKGMFSKLLQQQEQATEKRLKSAAEIEYKEKAAAAKLASEERREQLKIDLASIKAQRRQQEILEKTGETRQRDATKHIRTDKNRWGGNMRGSRVYSELIFNRMGLNKLDMLSKKYSDPESGLIPDKVATQDFSSTYSSIIKGKGQVAQALIDNTTYKSVFGTKQELQSFLDGKPRRVYTKDQLKQLVAGIKELSVDNHNAFARKLATDANAQMGAIRFAHPSERESLEYAYRHQLKRNEEGYYDPILIGTSQESYMPLVEQYGDVEGTSIPRSARKTKPTMSREERRKRIAELKAKRKAK